LLEMLEQVAKQGYAIEIDETDVGVMCIAAPVFAGDVVAGAISISLPTARAAAGNRATLVKLAQQAAAATSARLSKAARLSDR
jgi:DNA-binding IclR family transcriptional regulator